MQNDSTDKILEDLKMRLVLNRNMVFYTTIMYSLELSLSNEIPTACTNGKAIKFNPSFLGSLSKDEQEFLLVHEILHVCYEHMFRIGNRDPEKWNIANDHAINLELIAQGMKMIKGGMADPQYEGMSSEEIYELLPEPPEDFDMDLEQPEGDFQETQEQIKDMLIQAVQQAEMSNQIGSVPLSIQRRVNEWLNPVLPWYTILQRYMNQKCKDDYSWARRNRRFQDVYLPSLYSEQVGPIHFFIDGSCSVSDEMFSMQVGQIKWIKKNINPKEIRIIVFNTQIVDEFVFKDDQSINVDFNARGGTSIHEIVEYMEKHPTEANIIFTDGYFSHVDMSKVKSDVLWCIYDNPSFQYDKGKIIQLPLE